eukprot:2660076-Alexandrium_andersonii.AAC.1
MGPRAQRPAEPRQLRALPRRRPCYWKPPGPTVLLRRRLSTTSLPNAEGPGDESRLERQSSS